MLPLSPQPQAAFICPVCQRALAVTGWLVPGMRSLAALHCAPCGRRFYGDLPTGQAVWTPVLLDSATGTTTFAADADPQLTARAEWFAQWLQESYQHRTAQPCALSGGDLAPTQRHAILLNCLDKLYGHALLKLLNAQHYLENYPALDLIVLVPRVLAWLVPVGVRHVWVAELPLQRGTEWNDWLADEIRRRVTAWETCALSVAPSHPHPQDFAIANFTGITPFPLDEWAARLARPTVTFIWRTDRCWTLRDVPHAPTNLWQRGAAAVRPRLERRAYAPRRQAQLIATLAQSLRTSWPELDFGVVGLDSKDSKDAIHWPDWIQDWRTPTLDATTERQWCERYAASHIVVGVHGSNMLLPSAHAGSVVELTPAERWGNFLQDWLIRHDDARATLFRYRALPLTTTPHALAQVLDSMLRLHPAFASTFSMRF